MLVNVTPCTSSSECTFAEWSLPKAERKELVRTIAYLFLRQEENAMRVIEALDPERARLHGNIVDNVIAKLRGPRLKDLQDAQHASKKKDRKAAKRRVNAAFIHRDGHLFQFISWVAAKLENPDRYMTAPHVRRADKGFDGFIVELEEAGDKVARIVLCEDKASENPRPIINTSVWSEIEELQAGKRDDEILAELVTLLKGVVTPERAALLMDKLLWDECRGYRVSVATNASIRSKKTATLGHLMKGFEGAVGNGMHSRTGGVLALKKLRKGLQKLSDEIIEQVEAIADV